MRIADTDTAEQDPTAVRRQEVQAKQMQGLRPVDLLRPTPVESIKRLDARQTCRLHPTLDQGRIAALDLAGDQGFQQPAMRPRLAPRLRQEVGVMLGEERQRQALERRVQHRLRQTHSRLP